jgi:hypothetical protein
MCQHPSRHPAGDAVRAARRRYGRQCLRSVDAPSTQRRHRRETIAVRGVMDDRPAAPETGPPSSWGMHAGSRVGTLGTLGTLGTSRRGRQGRAARRGPSDRHAQEAGTGHPERPRRVDRPGRGARCRQEHPAGARTRHIARRACRADGGRRSRTVTPVRGLAARVRCAARPRAPTAAPAAGERGGLWPRGLRGLTRLVGDPRVSAEPESARQVVAACGGLPLTLRIVGARLALAHTSRRLAR